MKKSIIVIGIIFLYMLFIASISNAARYSLKEYGTKMTDAEFENVKIQLDLTNVKPSDSITNLGIMTNGHQLVNAQLNVEYAIRYKRAITIGSNKYDLRVCVIPTEINDSCQLMYAGDNTLWVKPRNSKVEITYEITDPDAFGGITGHYFGYGILDPDGGDYLFNPAGYDIYYVDGAMVGGVAPFDEYYSVYTDTSYMGISRFNAYNTDYNAAKIIIGKNGTARFTFVVDTTKDLIGATAGTGTEDYINLPIITYKPKEYTINYNLNNGSHGTYHPTEAVYENILRISNPTRTGYTFTGWTMTNGNTSTAKYGTSESTVTTSWSNANTPVTAQYFKNLTSTDGGTVTLVANWTANTYTIAYNLDGGTAGTYAPTSGTFDTNVRISNPTKTGYTFAGWTMTNGNTSTAKYGTSSTTVTTSWSNANTPVTAQYFKNLRATSGTVTLVANWTANTYTIAYTLNGGTAGTYAPTSGTFDINVRISNPTRTGYTFAGWTMTNGNTNTAKYGTSSTTVTTSWSNASTPVTAQYFKNLRATSGTVTLVANWTANTYTIAYTLDGGIAGANAPTSGTYDQVINISNPTRAGYTFSGWTMSNGNTSTAKYGTSSTTVTTSWSNANTKVTAQYFKNLRATSGTVTLVANWTAITYNITYSLGGGTNNSNNPSSYTVESNNINILAPTKTGYNFAGWQKTVSNLGWQKGYIFYATGEIGESNTYPNSYYSGYVSLKQNVTYTIGNFGEYSGTHWRLYDTSGTFLGSGTGTATSTTFAPTQDCYARILFFNQSTEAQRSATTIVGGVENNVIIPTGSMGNLALTANWTEITAPLTYNANGHGTAPAVVTMKYTTATNAAGEITVEGYDFTGWNTKADGSGTSYAAGAQVKAANVVPTATTLYAQWSEKTAPLTYNANGHGTAPAAVTMKYTTATNAASAITGVTGYTFAGWNTKANGSGTPYAAGARVKNANVEPTETTLYAQWTANTYTIAYNLNGGTAGTNAPTSGTFDQVVEIDNPTKTGYRFTGWTMTNGHTSTAMWGTTSSTVTNPWSNGNDQVTNKFFKNLRYDNGTVTLVATWRADHVRYEVNHWLQNIGGDANSHDSTNYTWEDGDQEYGDTGDEITPPVNTYPGFTSPQTQTVIVAGDGSTAVNYYYTRNSYTANFNSNGGTTASPSSITKQFEEQLGTLPTTSRTGYTFNGWFTDASGGTQISSSTTMPLNGATYYAHWTANTVTITIKRDNANWNANSGIKVELKQSGSTKYSGTASSSSISLNGVTAGTYDIYASKNASSLNTLVDTGLDVVVTSSGTATIDYYTLTLQAGVGISAVSGGGTYLKNQTANIDATVSNGFTWEGWSVISGDSPN